MKQNPSMVLAAQTNITWGNERLSFSQIARTS